MVIENNAVLTINCDISLPAGGMVIVNSGGQFIIEGGMFNNACDDIWVGIEVKSGGYLEVNSTTISDYSIIIKSGGTIRIVDDFNIQGNNQLDVDDDAYLCIEPGANINLNDYNSVINLSECYNNGVNPSTLPDGSACTIDPLAYPVNGKGSINIYNKNIYVQHETVYSEKYYAGKEIFAGSDVTSVKPTGPVTFKNTSDVTFSTNEAFIKGDFEIEKGGEFTLLYGQDLSSCPDKLKKIYAYPYGDASFSQLDPDENNSTTGLFAGQVWVNGGGPYIGRSVIGFDLHEVPDDADIQEAKLLLYGIDHNFDQTSPISDGYLEKITSSWQETQVTWNNQPTTTTDDRIFIPSPMTKTQDYSLDIKEILMQWINNTATNHGLMLKMKDETTVGGKLYFGSSDHSDDTKHPKIEITYY